MMSSVSIRLRGSHAAGIEALANVLKEEINAELIAESWRSLHDVRVVLLSFERYFFRNGSYASLTVLLTESQDMQTADIVGSGGGEGLFNISWGANSDFAEMAAELLRKYGFCEESQWP
ncbi:DUF6054 family protein [Butyricicoccus porcorum]|nr:DUF6054 family protein [Butyricicoccus porcorum]MCI6927286.1 DUF6054 family protein [Butyricicoccus porcorum]MDY4484062.1 DUF6054 family protein [Butyricicoccus porcorum]